MDNFRVLVIDASRTVRSYLEESLAIHGLHVVGCGTVLEGMAQLQEHDADLVIIEYEADDATSAEFASDLQQRLASTWTLILTSAPDACALVNAPRVRAVRKPDCPDLLVEAVLDLVHEMSPSAVSRLTEELPTVLIVDDSATFRMAMRVLLSTRWEVREAASGAQALMEHSTRGVDAVLLDLGLPDMEGTDVCRALRRVEVQHNLPIIMLTAADDDQAVLASFDAGADDYVVKGCRDEVLLARIGSHIRRRCADRRIRQVAADLRTTEAVSIARADLLVQFDRQAHELQQVNEELERFAAMASHDLQAPLRAVSNHIGVVQRWALSLDEHTRSHLDKAVAASVRMGELIKRLLHYSNCGWEDAVGDVVCDTTAVAREAVQTLEMQVTETDARIQIDELPAVVFDPLCLRQLFENLISNAIKYRSGRPLEIHIGSRADGGAVAITVSDNGEGIATANLGRVFGMFERLHGAEISGAGIGLALCQKIVAARGGTMGVESQLGVGSVFRFTIPVARLASRPTLYLEHSI